MRTNAETALCELPRPLADLTAREALQLLDGYQSARAGLPLDETQEQAWQEGWHRFRSQRPASPLTIRS